MAGLSEELETLNTVQATRVRCGSVYTAGSIGGNTKDFISFEQHYVECALQRLRAQSITQYTAEIRAMNRSLRRAALWLSHLLSPAHRAMYQAIHSSRIALCRFPDFRNQRDREMLGLQLCEVPLPVPGMKPATEPVMRMRPRQPRRNSNGDPLV
jgi:hypothetical protein